MLQSQDIAAPLDERYVSVATEMQRWRDFAAHVCAYLVMNAIFVGVWALGGKGSFWPIYPLLGWGVGLSFQHFHVVLRGQITDADVRRYLSKKAHRLRAWH